MTWYMNATAYIKLQKLNQISMQTEHCVIDHQFIIAKNYVLASEESKRRNMILNNYLDMIESIFKAYNQFAEELQQPFKSKVHEKSPFVAEFKDFIRNLSMLLQKTSVFQIDYITEAKISPEDMISQATKNIVNKIECYEKPQRSLVIQREKYNHYKQLIKDQLMTLTNQSKEPYIYFNSKYMMGRSRSLQDKLEEIKKLELDLEKSLRQTSTNSHEFETYLTVFRKRLLQNKYYALNKMIDYSKKFRDSLTQIMLFLVECTNKKSEQFQKLINTPQREAYREGKKKQQIGEKEDLITSIINSVQEYNIAIDETQKAFKYIDDGLKRLFDKISAVIQNKKVFLQCLNTLYDIEENPSMQVLETFDLFAGFTQKFCSISDKIYHCSKQLSFLRNNVTKHADVTLSLLRMKTSKASMNQKKPKVDQLYEQINYQFISDILNEAYRSFRETFSQLKTIFNQKYYKKKKHTVQNSMQLSHVDETVFALKKRPCKKQIWLWKDWRDRNNFHFQPIQKIQNQIRSFLKTVNQSQPSESPVVGKYECTLNAKKDSKGVLKICEKHIQFISFSSHNNIDLIIPFGEIQDIESKIKVFQKILCFHTTNGDLSFSRLHDIEDAKQIIKQRMQNCSTPAKKVQKKQSVKLSESELQCIKRRIEKYENQLPSVQGMAKVSEVFIDSITIDQVYDVIYSDKPFTLRGKPEETFFAYSIKKAKNSNYTTTPYTPAGPQFYTLEKGQNFQNCPLYSTRVNQFDHPLPPMPFMPKFCHNKQQAKLYWISHQRFDYLIDAESSGAPYADTFKVKVLHRITKENNGVKIEIYQLLYFIKETAMKGMLQSKGQKEMTTSSLQCLNDIQSALKSVVMANGAEPTQQGQQNNIINDTNEREEQKSEKGSEVDKLKAQNKMLIGGLLLVIIINILLKILAN